MLRVQKLFAVALAAGAAATVPAVSQASTDRNSCLSQGQGVNHYALVRERARLRARPPVIGCVPAGVKVLGARIDWGDGTSTPVAVEERAQAAQIVLLSRVEHRYGRANCPASRRLLYRCRAGYRMVLAADLSDGATVESEPVDVSVLAAADRVSLGAVSEAGHQQQIAARLVCGG